MAFTDRIRTAIFKPAAGPKIPPRTINLNLKVSNMQKHIPRGEICLSLDLSDTEIGYFSNELGGPRLMVNVEQANALAVTVLRFAFEQNRMNLLDPAQAFDVLYEQLAGFVACNIHCNEQTPPADGNSK